MAPVTRRRSASSTPRTKVITKSAADINTANTIDEAFSEEEVAANAEPISGSHVLIDVRSADGLFSSGDWLSESIAALFFSL